MRETAWCVVGHPFQLSDGMTSAEARYENELFGEQCCCTMHSFVPHDYHAWIRRELQIRRLPRRT